MYAVVVTFQITQGDMAAFLPLMHQNAAMSLKHEDGCHRFDVCTDPERPDEVFLYELYTDEAAFDVHRSTAHFASFGTQAGSMIAAKEVRTYQDVST